MPEFAIDPGHAGDEAVRFDRAENRARFRIDLINLALAIVTYPQRAFGPREPRVAAGTRSRARSTCTPLMSTPVT